MRNPPPSRRTSNGITRADGVSTARSGLPSSDGVPVARQLGLGRRARTPARAAPTSTPRPPASSARARAGRRRRRAGGAWRTAGATTRRAEARPDRPSPRVAHQDACRRGSARRQRVGRERLVGARAARRVRPRRSGRAPRRPRPCAHRARRTRSRPAPRRRRRASASSVGTPPAAARRANASPLATPSPMRSPVNEPGPIDTASASTSRDAEAGAARARARSAAAAMPRASAPSRSASSASDDARRATTPDGGGPGRGVDPEDAAERLSPARADGCRCRTTNTIRLIRSTSPTCCAISRWRCRAAGGARPRRRRTRDVRRRAPGSAAG